MDATDLTCRELVELVTSYLDDAMPAAERARFDAHLAECPWCRRYLAQMQRTILLLGELTEESMAPAARDSLLERFRDWHRR